MIPEIIQPNFRARPSLVSLGDGLYRYPNRKDFYERPYIHGKQTIRKLRARTLKAARDELARRRVDRLDGKPDAFTRSSRTVADLAQFYLDHGCPDRKERHRTGIQLEEETRRVEWLVRGLGRRHASAVGIDDWRDYAAWRRGRFRPGFDGSRTIDMERQTLRAIYRWAKRNPRRTGIVMNPVDEDWPRFNHAEDVTHCREHQPANADELWAIADALFTYPRSQVLGFLCLIQSMIGQRVHELLKLRWDARNEDEPGYIAEGRIWLYRSRSTKGTFPYAEIHPALAQVLQRFKDWHSDRRSQWWFPSPVDPSQPIDRAALTRALRRVCKRLGIPLRTSHGLRSYYVNVLRSQGISDADIALRIGHRTGGKLIVQVYGEILPVKIGWERKAPPRFPQAGRGSD